MLGLREEGNLGQLDRGGAASTGLQQGKRLRRRAGGQQQRGEHAKPTQGLTDGAGEGVHLDQTEDIGDQQNDEHGKDCSRIFTTSSVETDVNHR